MIYPWLGASHQMLADAYQNKKLHHALLLQGVQGIGKQTMAVHLAGALLCPNQQNLTACGQCKSCHLLAAQSHPDYLVLGHEQKTIGVDEVRKIADFCQTSAGQRGAKVVVVNDADLMTTAAANALLKTLEEPANNRFLILVSAQAERLPATVLSRCSQVTLSVDDAQLVEQWMAETDSKIDWQSWQHLFLHQPLLLLKWQQNEDHTILTNLYGLVQQLKNGISAQLLVDILQQKSEYSSVFYIFVCDYVKQALLKQQLDFKAYQICLQHLLNFQQAVKQVLGLNFPLAVSDLVFALQQQLKR